MKKMQMRLLDRGLCWIVLPLTLLLSWSLPDNQNISGFKGSIHYPGGSHEDSVVELKEVRTLYAPVLHNQGIATDGKYIYVSPDHNTIEKRNIRDFKLVKSATYPNKIGGLFYDSIAGEILTGSGQYVTGGDAFISRIDPDDLRMIKTVDISRYTEQGINAIVRVGNRIYVGETAVASDAKPKSWYLFSSDFKFIGKVYSHASDKGRYNWQDATVYKGRIYATDHKGFVFAFKILPDGKLLSLGSYNSLGQYPEGIAYAGGRFLLWKAKQGIVQAQLQ